jgi:hypothetical protein
MSQPTPGSTKGLPTTPKRKSILTNKQTTESPEASPTSPTSASQHTYTSLASVRKANKAAGGTPDRDRKNGWHLWSAEEAERNGGQAGAGNGGGDVERGGSHGGGGGLTKKDGKKKERLTQWNMVSVLSLWCLMQRMLSLMLVATRC